MNAGNCDTTELGNAITAALTQLDLRGEDPQVTRAMAIVTEAFLIHSKGRRVTPEALLAKSNDIANACDV